MQANWKFFDSTQAHGHLFASKENSNEVSKKKMRKISGKAIS